MAWLIYVIRLQLFIYNMVNFGQKTDYTLTVHLAIKSDRAPFNSSCIISHLFIFFSFTGRKREQEKRRPPKNRNPGTSKFRKRRKNSSAKCRHRRENALWGATCSFIKIVASSKKWRHEHTIHTTFLLIFHILKVGSNVNRNVATIIL